MNLSLHICLASLFVGTVYSEYLGCYYDKKDDRRLPDVYTTFSRMTPQMCIDYCKRKSYAYAGLQYSIYCFCGNQAPDEFDKRPESHCSVDCPGEKSSKCGGTWRNSVYKTGKVINTASLQKCMKSATTVNSKPTCSNDIIFEESFDELSPKIWTHDVKIPLTPDYQFVMYDSKPANSFISDGKLVIKPTFLPPQYVTHGKLTLENCTANRKTECTHLAMSYNILPPVRSARLTTRKSFSFKYGKVEVTAKLPLGDWLVPEIQLEPMTTLYSPRKAASGRIRIAMSRGNKDLKTKDGYNIGCKLLESRVAMDFGNDETVTKTAFRINEDGWYKDYHNYTLIWSPDDIVFSVDGENPVQLLTNKASRLQLISEYPQIVSSIRTSTAPFTTNDFYISLGLSVGGVTDFPDLCISSGQFKPWRNSELKAMFRFWRNRNSWKATWKDDLALLQVDHIKVTAL